MTSHFVRDTPVFTSALKTSRVSCLFERPTINFLFLLMPSLFLVFLDFEGKPTNRPSVAERLKVDILLINIS